MARKRKPGRPVSTGSADTKPVIYRVSAEQYADLKAEGRATKPRRTPNQVAKDRAFPEPSPVPRGGETK